MEREGGGDGEDGGEREEGGGDAQEALFEATGTRGSCWLASVEPTPASA